MTGTLQQPPPMAPSQANRPEFYVGFSIIIAPLPTVESAYPAQNVIGVFLLQCAVKQALAASGMECEAYIYGPELNVTLGLCRVGNRRKGLEVIRDTLKQCQLLSFAQIGWLNPDGVWVTWYPQPCTADFNHWMNLELLEELGQIARSNERQLYRLLAQYGSKEP